MLDLNLFLYSLMMKSLEEVDCCTAVVGVGCEGLFKVDEGAIWMLLPESSKYSCVCESSLDKSTHTITFLKSIIKKLRAIDIFAI